MKILITIVNMDAKEIILDVAAHKKQIKTTELAELLGLSRQHTHKLVKDLVIEKKLTKFGSTASSFYTLPENAKSIKDNITQSIRNENVQEHDVLMALEKKSPFLGLLQENVKSIFEYAFSEMLNNAVEHSHSPNINIQIEKDTDISFQIEDKGIGVFQSILIDKRLDSELEAIQELLKGKTTTMPHAHSGEGIFFTSKIADYFSLESHALTLVIDNVEKDITVIPNKRTKRGTCVHFRIKLKSNKHLNDIFSKYESDPEEHAFDKTDIYIKLYTTGGIHVSRSQARRILNNLEKFKVVTLDFDKVPNIGQAFADEIFRVFPQKFPGIKIIPVNMNETVRFMIERAINTER